MGCSNQFVWVLLAGAVFIMFITMTAIFLSVSDGPKSPYTLDDYFNNTIRWKSYNLYWISDSAYLHKTRDGNIYLHNVVTQTNKLFLSNSTFDDVNATDYLLSGDHKYVALESNYVKQWRHSYTASYYIYDLVNRGFVEEPAILDQVQYFSWGPKENKFAFVRDYNIYYKSDVDADPVQVTSNGENNKFLNGVPDWVYEEEVFASNGAMWWSTTGRYLAYAEFDVTKVNKVEFPLYGDEQYSKTVKIAYPKAGTPLTKVKLLVFDTRDSHLAVKWINAPSGFKPGDYYLSSVTWVTDERIAVQWLTRKQNSLLVHIYDFNQKSWRLNQNFQQTSKTGWIGHYGPLPLFFAEDKISFYKVLSDSSGYKHIHYIKRGIATPITSGNWEVIYITKLTKDAIYFVAYEDDGAPLTRNVYKVAIGMEGPSPRECLTCNFDKQKCQYNLAYFNSDATFYRLDCYGPGLPRFMLVDNRSPESTNTTLEDNQEIGEILKEFGMPKMKYGTINIEGFDLWYEMMLPPNFVSSRQYPLLLDVYGGPCSQRVDYRFKLNWSTFLASTYGIIVAKFDGRGSGYRGDKIMHSIYRRLGTIEVEDQITAVRKFSEMRFVDKTRIAIWGWSYGGYVTSMALSAGTGLFKCGIAVAPVASWQYYDAVYTERYMGMPQENVMGYKNGSVIERAKHFKGTKYLLIHGTADDNVHFQHGAQITKALVDEQVNFEAMWYTDKDHSLTGASQHTYEVMSNFLKQCLVKQK